MTKAKNVDWLARKTTHDYIFCIDCKMMCDYWKYDHNIKDAGHEKCLWRYVTKEELKECIKDCKREKCEK